MATLQEIADGLEVRLATISGLRVSSEPTEKSEPAGDENVVAEIVYQSRAWLTPCNYRSRFLILLSANAMPGEWARAVQRVRLYLDASGSRSVEAAIEADRTLGGQSGVDAVVVEVGPEKLMKFGNAERWTGRVTVDVFHP